MANEHVSGIPQAIVREYDKQRQDVVFIGDRLLQGADLNDAQAIIRQRQLRVGRMVAKDGDRQEGGEAAIIDADEETVLLNAGRIFAEGDVFPIGSALLTEVPMEGEVIIGAWLTRSWIDHETDPMLLGQVLGTEAEGEPGSARELVSLSWGLADDEVVNDAKFVPVYLLKNGTIIDNQPPPTLSGVMKAIGEYDYDANGHYIVDGCNVSAIGKQGADWIFSIEAGTANIEGYKRIRETALRVPIEEEADLEDVVAEIHTYTGATNSPTTVNVNRAPISSVTSAIIIKRVTENIIRGASPNTMDDLQFNSATLIESIPGYVLNTDYVLTSGKVSWVPGGAEPLAGATYAVTYLYAAAVTPTAVTPTSVTVTGGVNGTQITLRYDSKLPRIDLMCLGVAGTPQYVKGQPARVNALAPIEPTTLLKLAEIHNNWLTNPTIINNGVRNFTYAQQRRLFGRLIDMLDQFDRFSSQMRIIEASPVSKKGIFTDNFVDDFYRDQGVAQTAACNAGVLQLAIDPTLRLRVGLQPETIAYTHSVIISQPLKTNNMKINPYANFSAMPAGMTIEPAVDFWTETVTQWTSAETREFTTAPGQPPGQTVITEQVTRRSVVTPVLRQIEIEVTLEGFGAGENLAALTFDGVNVKPPGTQTADVLGSISLTFDIPPNVPEGIKRIRAEGAAGSFAEARFVGDGTIEIAVMRRVTLITREAPPPPQIINIINNITNVTQTTINNLITQVVPPAAVVNPPIVENPWASSPSDDDGGSISSLVDPLAQTFTLPSPQMVTGVNVYLHALGDPINGVRVQLAEVTNGYPSAVVLAEDFIPMAGKVPGQTLEARFDLPVYCAPGREYCFVVMTDDPNHSIKIAKLGDVYGPPDAQQRVGGQPYTVGIMFSSANRLTWTAHQDADIAFELLVANFTSNTRTVVLWTGPLDEVSDLQVRCPIELPTNETKFALELVRASGEVIPFTPGQTLEFTEYVDETVTVRAVMTGNSRLSPILYPGTMIVGGKLRASGTYVTRNFPFGSAVEASALVAANLPAGSTMSMDVRVDAGSWQAMTLDSTGTLGAGWVEPKYKKASLTGTQGQIRMTINGTPAARPKLAIARAYTI